MLNYIFVYDIFPWPSRCKHKITTVPMPSDNYELIHYTNKRQTTDAVHV